MQPAFFHLLMPFGILEGMAYTTLFFDLDNTLYPPKSGVWEAITERINLYLSERMHFPADQVLSTRHHLYTTYGTTMRGLQLLYNIDPHEYLAFVHDVPLDHFLRPNPILRPLLQRYPQRRVILTNADCRYAARVLSVLGVEDCFEQIIDILDLSPYCKPHPESFTIALNLAGGLAGQECVFMDDTLANLVTARKMGFYTVWVGGDQPDSQCDAAIAAIDDLPAALDPILCQTLT